MTKNKIREVTFKSNGREEKITLINNRPINSYYLIFVGFFNPKIYSILKITAKRIYLLRDGQTSILDIPMSIDGEPPRLDYWILLKDGDLLEFPANVGGYKESYSDYKSDHIYLLDQPIQPSYKWPDNPKIWLQRDLKRPFDRPFRLSILELWLIFKGKDYHRSPIFSTKID